MNTSLLASLASFHRLAQQHHVRVPILVLGDPAFFAELCALDLPLVVISDRLTATTHYPWSQVKGLLGQALGSVMVDIRDGVDVDKFCALSGCVRGGELVLLLIDAQDNAHYQHGFLKRVMRFLQQPQLGLLTPSRCRLPRLQPLANAPYDVIENDQALAINAIKQVLYGHRRRPALLVADRGRGKSAAMGMASADILLQAKKKIAVTAPKVNNVQTLFTHAAATLAQAGARFTQGKYDITLENGSQLQFIAPDLLLDTLPAVDLLLVDEAAALPLPILCALLRHYSRIAFSTTEHGYEGSGRGFSTHFKALLDDIAPGWQQVRLHAPIRWAAGDMFEQWLFDLFLFSAEPQLVCDDEATLPSPRAICYQKITGAQLEDEALLRQLFSLLIASHYQTSPNDLVQLLNGDAASMLGAFCGDVLVGIAIAHQEGEFSFDLALEVAQGKRRMKGHLLAQSLASHLGLAQVLTHAFWRVVRIAVVDNWRNQGIGKRLVQQLEQDAMAAGVDWLGASFGATDKLWRFWRRSDFTPARLGVSKDAASGCYSLQVIKPLHNASALAALRDDIQHLFCCNFPYQLAVVFGDMAPDLVAALCEQQDIDREVSALQQAQVALFAKGGLGFDLIVGSLHCWLLSHLSTKVTKPCNGRSVVIAKILQQRSWAELSKQYQLRGRKEVETLMRQWIVTELTPT